MKKEVKERVEGKKDKNGRKVEGRGERRGGRVMGLRGKGKGEAKET